MANRVAVMCIVAAFSCGKSQPASDPSEVASDPSAGTPAQAQPAGSGGMVAARAGATVAAASGAGGAGTGPAQAAAGVGGSSVAPPASHTPAASSGAWPTFGGDVSHTRSQRMETAV